MKIGFIGAGKAGCSMGKYFALHGTDGKVEVSGYYSLIEEEAKWAAEFTNSMFFTSMDEVIEASDSIILSTPDGEIKNVWNCMNKNKVKGKIVCHLSGSLSSDVFSGIDNMGAYPISIHPMFAFSNKESVYEQLHQVSFTLEGHSYAIKAWKDLFDFLGNATLEIAKEVKPKYHAAASLLSNHVIAVLNTGYELLVECGFSEEEARSFSKVLVQDNVMHVIEDGTVKALTGPIERADVETLRKHLAVMDEKQQHIYKACGTELVSIARKRNPERDYLEVEQTLK